MKSYTDLEQSKKLSEILPIESADMTYCAITEGMREKMIIKDWQVNIGLDIAIKENLFSYRNGYMLPCWSLAALLDVLQKTAYFIDEDANVVLCSYKTVEWNLGINNSDVEFTTKTNTIDACYEMILKLNEQKLL
jgi:hypothetical protein